MPEWLVERGIGEVRAALVEEGRILQARIELEGAVPVGAILEVRLTRVGPHGRNAVATDLEGREYLLAQAPQRITEGAQLVVEVTREAIPGTEPWKRPRARASDREACALEPLEQRLGRGSPVRELPFPPNRADALGEAGWGDVMEEASSAEVGFDGGSLTISLTPAMTLIDVDGWLAPAELSVAGAAAAARAIRRLDIGGSIGIDLPTVAGKAARQRAAEAIDASLPQPFERTQVNGFGFVQIVRPRLRPSLPEIWADRPSAEARAVLRRAALERTGPTRLVAHRAVTSVLERNPLWLATLSRQIGGAVTLRSEPTLPIHGAYAEAG